MLPGPAAATSISRPVLPEVTRKGGDHVWPPSLDHASKPVSLVPLCVSQVAYSFPDLSTASDPSIHHVARAMLPAPGSTATGFDQVAPPSLELVKYSVPGPTASVDGSVGWPQ